jgi:multimeric flavodoxin WrbA
MEQNGVIIQGSARSRGNTNTIVKYIVERTKFDVIDLNSLTIGQFNYDFENSDDDFLPVSRKIADQYQTIVFATPVYWYSMSGIMKAFFDRITDLLRVEKDTGRKLRGKNMALISCGSEAILQKGFTMPFVESANYLGMNYLGDIHTWLAGMQIPAEIIPNLDSFSDKLKQSIS